jgi:hypothetical protein
LGMAVLERATRERIAAVLTASGRGWPAGRLPAPGIG